MAFVETVPSDKGDLIWANVNSKDMLPVFIQAFADSVLLIQQSLEAYWLIQKAEMYLTDALRVASTGITALNLVKEIAVSVAEVVQNAADMSFHALMLPLKSGGLSDFTERFRYHLYDASDTNRPMDEGSAVLLPLVFLTSGPDMTRTAEAFDNIDNLFGKFKKDGGVYLKSFQGKYGDPEYQSSVKGFWKHYYNKRIVGSRKKVIENGWYKQSLLGGLPENGLKWLNTTLASWAKIAEGAPDSSSLIEQTQGMYDTIFETIKEISIIIDGYTRLFLDQQITLLKFPAIHGEPINAGNSQYTFNKELFDMLADPDIDLSGKKPAYEILAEYLLTLPDLLQTTADNLEKDSSYGTSLEVSEASQLELFGKIKVSNPFNKENVQTNAANFLREDYFVGGFVMVFKGPSIEVVTAQVKTFLSIFGLSLEGSEKEGANLVVTPIEVPALPTL